MGKILVEKLLRSCPDIENIYILCRPKKGKDVHTRVEEIYDDQVCYSVFLIVIPIPNHIPFLRYSTNCARKSLNSGTRSWPCPETVPCPVWASPSPTDRPWSATWTSSSTVQPRCALTRNWNWPSGLTSTESEMFWASAVKWPDWRWVW